MQDARKDNWHAKVHAACLHTEAQLDKLRPKFAGMDELIDILEVLAKECRETRRFAVREAYAQHSQLIQTLTQHQISEIEKNNHMLPVPNYEITNMPPRPQPYHRAGAMDVNARISTENALNMHVQTTGQPEAIYGPQCATNMQLSIQVGEPLYSHKRSVLGDYRPISILSGMNGLFFHQTAYDHLCNAATVASNVPKRTDNSIEGYLNAYDKLRDSFFSNLSYTGVSIDVWDYADDAQSDRIAITEGGLNTIDCDGPIYCGDIVIADMPWTRELCNGSLERNGGRGANVATPYGLTECERSMKKVTLAVVALPRRPVNLHKDDDEAWRKFINGFHARGQIIGKCAKGNCSSKGGAIDIIQGICVGGQM